MYVHQQVAPADPLTKPIRPPLAPIVAGSPAPACVLVIVRVGGEYVCVASKGAAVIFPFSPVLM